MNQSERIKNLLAQVCVARRMNENHSFEFKYACLLP